MRIYTLSKRCAKEILRDPINLGFGLGFPVILLLLLSLMQSNIPVDMFKIESLAPGIGVFGLSFLTLFSATLVAKDRENAFTQRLYTAPIKPYEFILGYILPLIPIAVGQSAVTYLISVPLGLPLSVNIIFAVLMAAPISVFYISVGLLCGSVLGVKQVGGICGALFTNVSAWLSGVWFDLSLLGGTLERIARFLPFAHAVEIEKMLVKGDTAGILSHVLPVLAYAVITVGLAVLLFFRQMKKR